MSQTSDMAPCELAAGKWAGRHCGQVCWWAVQAEGSGGRWIQHVQPWGGTAAGSLDGSEPYLTQVLP